MTRDLRLVPVALAVWVVAVIAIGCGEGIGAAAAVAWAAALAVVLVAARRRGPLSGSLALVLAAVALVLTATAAGLERRAPVELRTAAQQSRVVELDLVVTGRPVDGWMRATTVAGAPVLVFGRPGDEVPRDCGIGDLVVAGGVLQRAEPGDDVAFLLFERQPMRVRQEAGGPVAAAGDLRRRFAEVAAELPGPGAGLLPGLGIGDTSAVTPGLDADMKASSLSHLTAVSGSNCAVVVGLVFAAAAAAGLSRLARVGAALTALAGFVVLVTPEPSVVRAAVMAGVALVALASSRPGAGLPVLCVAVTGLLVVDPWLARSYGFALSVLATAGLIVLASPIADRLARWLPRWLALLVAIPLAAQLACQPVLLLLDPTLPLYGVAANALAEPAAPLATIAGLVSCLLATLAPPLAVPVAWLAWLPASWVAAVASFTAGLPGARSPWPTGAAGLVLLIALTGLVIVLVLRAGPPSLRRVVARMLTVALIAYLGAVAGGRIATEAGKPADWQIALCDVGQGDAILVRSAGAVALIDTGPEPEALGACLSPLGVTRIQLLVLTHYDLDHVGGVPAVLGRVDRVLIGPPSDDADAAIVEALAAGGATVRQVARGEAGRIGELDWRVLWPPASGVQPGNAASLTLLMQPSAGCRCLSGLFLGDLGEESQQRLLGALRQGGGVPRVDVVKVAHHGSGDQSAALYDTVRAGVGLIGVGADNGYGHPTQKLLGILAEAGTTARRSDLNGLVLVAPGERHGEVRVWTQR